VVVLEGSPPLKDGTIVAVVTVEEPAQASTLSTDFLKYTNVFILAFPNILRHGFSARKVRILCQEKAHSP
jgi:hypothetical protein